MIPSGRQNPRLGSDPEEQHTMPLDLTVSSTNVTDDNSLDTFLSYDFENGDDPININNEIIDNNDYEEGTDAEKYNVLDILNEMRLEEPLGDEFNVEYQNNNDLHPYNNFNLVDSTEDFSTYYNNTFNKTNVLDEYKSEDGPTNNNELDLLLYPEFGSTLNVQLEVIDSTVQFQYDAIELFDEAPDMELPYPDVPDTTVQVAAVDNNNVNETKCINQTSYNETEPSQRFECSTNLPMTLDEIEKDINNTFNKSQNSCAASFYDCSFHDYSNERTETENMYPYSSETLPNYITEQNRLFENLEAVNPIEPIEIPTAPPVNNSQCDMCSHEAKSKHGLSKHIRAHSTKRFKCKHCHYWSECRYTLKRHLRYNHQRKYSCPRCYFFTRCSSRIKRHMRWRH